MEYITRSLSETDMIAKQILSNLKNQIKDYRIIALNGDLGSGKTTFSRFFVKHLGSESLVSSPTFSLVNHYTSKGDNNKKNNNQEKDINIFHFDMYRIKTEDDLYSIGFFDYLSDCLENKNNENILIIEWAENILGFLPAEVVAQIININFKYIDDCSRKIEINF